PHPPTPAQLHVDRRQAGPKFGHRADRSGGRLVRPGVPHPLRRVPASVSRRLRPRLGDGAQRPPRGREARPSPGRCPGGPGPRPPGRPGPPPNRRALAGGAGHHGRRPGAQRHHKEGAPHGQRSPGPAQGQQVPLGPLRPLPALGRQLRRQLHPGPAGIGRGCQGKEGGARGVGGGNGPG
ncbi:hypothetical protein chiPu_0030809, partial [Chiloscyllium punctatum]|nr:hypothetical protein [Chiloscyllium punctatum]